MSKYNVGRDHKMRAYAKQIGYRTLTDAIIDIGRIKFIEQFNSYKPKKKKPIPKPNGRRPKYPFREMLPGDSFIVDKEYTPELMTKYGNAARNWKNKAGFTEWRFSMKKTAEGIRLSRVK